MIYPERFSTLPVATWPRLRALLDHRPAGDEVINMTIGEPQHALPDFVAPIIAEHLQGFKKYPDNNGTPALLEAIIGWVDRRYNAQITPENLMVLNGTREGLFNAALALSPTEKADKDPVILLPNPYYSSYPAAAKALGAAPVYLPALAGNGWLPDFAGLDQDTLDRTTVAYICSPTNPQGATADAAYWSTLLQLAEKHDFKVFADECYSEIYRDTPPLGALEMVTKLGTDPERVVAFHSLSKRSNLAGLRSGFVCSGPENIKHIRKLRAYAGAPVPGPLQAVAAAAWADEEHVNQSRALYQEKFTLVDSLMGDLPGYLAPQAGFFLCLPVPDGEEATTRLWDETGVRVLPGAYLAQDVNGTNPGQEFIRVALVAPKQDIQRGLIKIRDCLFD
jgi:aspartate/methionine/tyrosine aminotransferase